jgi:hypothetical protein
MIEHLQGRSRAGVKRGLGKDEVAFADAVLGQDVLVDRETVVTSVCPVPAAVSSSR